ncbi:integrin alpha, partial [bacterium]|nr:integrin alpha [bacterium]
MCNSLLGKLCVVVVVVLVIANVVSATDQNSRGLANDPVWIGENNNAGSMFGVSTSTAGDVNGDGYADIVVGAYNYDEGSGAVGKIYVYLGSASGPTTSPHWWATGGQTGSMTGLSVATAGDVNGDGYSDIIVGAPGFDNTEQDEGIVVVYYGSGSGMGTPERAPDWFVESNQVGAFFGISVNTAGDVNGDGYSDVIIGAYLYDNGETDEGVAYVYHGSASGLATSPSWTGQCDHPGAHFGQSVATAGDVNRDGYSDVIVGAPGFDIGVPDSNEGKAFVYLGGADKGISMTPIWSDVGEMADAEFGFAVSEAGSIKGSGICDILVGSPGYSSEQVDEGAFYIYAGHLVQGVESEYYYRMELDLVGAALGRAVAPAGDVNGDGFADIIVGMPFYNPNPEPLGNFLVYFGQSDGFFQIGPEGGGFSYTQSGANLGISVATAGDVNGDGFSDIIAGAWKFDNPEVDEGQAYVYLGEPDDLTLSATWTDELNQEHGYFGYSVACAGDINADGYDDIVVGAIGYKEYSWATTGAVYTFNGSYNGLATSYSRRVDGNYDGMQMGYCVAGAGDVNGDGYDDVLYSAPGRYPGGKVFLHRGTSSGMSETSSWDAQTTEYGARFGNSLSSAGDVNGDGYSDVIIGAYQWNSGTGVVTAYYGSSSGLSETESWVKTGTDYHDYYGYSVSCAGDVNGDGYSDVIIGAHGASHHPDTDGAVYVHHGSPTGLHSTPSWIAFDNNPNVAANFGQSVAGAGDVNGDGYSDVIIGEPEYGGSGTSEPAGSGRALIYLGSSSGLESSPSWTYCSGVFE